MRNGAKPPEGEQDLTSKSKAASQAEFRRHWTLILAASIVWFTAAEGRFMPRELLIGLFLTVTTPVTLILLARAALFRDRTEKPPTPPED